MSRDHRVLLEDMLESCERILQYGEGLSFEQFSEGGMVFDAVVRRLSIVGEAAARVPKDVKDRNPEVEWRKIVGLRNIVIHQYSDADEEILWDVMHHGIPELKSQLERMLGRESRGG